MKVVVPTHEFFTKDGMPVGRMIGQEEQEIDQGVQKRAHNPGTHRRVTLLDASGKEVGKADVPYTPSPRFKADWAELLVPDHITVGEITYKRRNDDLFIESIHAVVELAK